MSHKRTTAASAHQTASTQGLRLHPTGAVPARTERTAWEARYRINGAWSGWNSLGTIEWDDAIFIAVDRLAEREQAAKAGITRRPARNARRTLSTR